MTEYFLSALVFGLSSGIKPGPLGILVIQQTLANGLKVGLQVSLAPIITDGPIIFLALILLTQFKEITIFLGLLSLFGGLYLLWIAYKVVKIQELNVSKSLGAPTSLAMAIKVNFLSPNPYLFWFTVGGTYIVQGSRAEAIVFVLVSLSTLVLSKMAVALVTANFKELLDSNTYLLTMRFLGLMLGLFGILFLIKSQNLLFG